jgi:hypothetical protein
MASGPLEGLTYFLKSDVNMSNFIEFIRDGKKDAGGLHVTDPRTGGLQTGVLNWLRGIHVFDANFFTATEPAPMVVVSLAQTGIPWIGIPGFMDFVATDIPALNLGNGQIQLESRRDLDAALSASRSIFNGLAANNRRNLEEALRGDAGTNLSNAIAAIDGAGSGIADLLIDARAIGDRFFDIDARRR